MRIQGLSYRVPSLTTVSRFRDASIPHAVTCWLCTRCLSGEEGAVHMTLSLRVLGAGLSWDGIPEVNLREEWVVGDGKTSVPGPKSSLCGATDGGRAWWA